MPRTSPCRVQETKWRASPLQGLGTTQPRSRAAPLQGPEGQNLTQKYPFCLWHHRIQIPLLPLTPSQYFEPVLRCFYTSKFNSQVSWGFFYIYILGLKVQNNGSLIDHRCLILLLICGREGVGGVYRRAHCLCHKLKNESCSRALLLLVLLLPLLTGQHKTCEQFQCKLLFQATDRQQW